MISIKDGADSPNTQDFNPETTMDKNNGKINQKKINKAIAGKVTAGIIAIKLEF